MEDLSFEKGIFIHSENLETKFMVESLEALLQICPNVKITSVECDERFDGFKVYFGDSEARSVLEKGNFEVKNRSISVYPLGTYLLVHDIHSRETDEIERGLTETVNEKFGKVLHLQKLADHPTDKATSSYLVLIDIPENKFFSIFTRNGYPKMSMAVPSMCKTFRLSFWCRRCKAYGHSYKECFEICHEENRSEASFRRTGHRPQDETKSPSGNSTDNATKLQSEIRMDAKRLFNMAKVAVEKSGVSSILEPTDSFANKLGRELVMSAGLSTENNASGLEVQSDPLLARLAESLMLASSIRKSNDDNTLRKKHISKNESKPRQDNSTGRGMFCDREIKQEVEDHSSQFIAQPIFQTDMCRKDEQRDPESSLEHLQNNGDSRPFPADATSTTDADDDIQIIDDTPMTGVQQHRKTSPEASTSFSDGIKKETLSAEDLSSERLPTTPQAPYFPNSSRHSEPSASFSSPRYQVTGCLSGRLQGCINGAYDVYGILDTKTLNAFLAHVKKKSNPMRVADNYTKNVLGLKEQLKQILHFYYNTPQTGTKDDIQFIKWLTGLVERFDGTVPRKRKPSGKLRDETPKKK